VKYEERVEGKTLELDPQAIHFAAKLYGQATAEEVTLLLNQMALPPGSGGLPLFETTLKAILKEKPEVLAAALHYIAQKGFPNG
jgi:hypothetical protein